MKNRKLKTAAVLLFAVMLIGVLPVVGSHAAGATVAYLMDGGAGLADGSSPENAAPSLDVAFAALDLSQDCTVVICGPFLMLDEWNWGVPYTGSVTYTSVYNGIDYRETAGAVFSTEYKNFVCAGATIFENMILNCVTANGIHIDCQFYPFKIGYGLEVQGDFLTGLSDAKSVFIVGGFQSGKGEAVMGATQNDRSSTIEVYSGTNLLIIAGSRGFSGEIYTGTVSITVGGTAEVGAVYTGGLKNSECLFGRTNLIVQSGGVVKNMYTTTNNQKNCITDSLHVYYYGGSIGGVNEAVIDATHEDGDPMTFTNGKHLHVTADIAAGLSDDFKYFFSDMETVTAPAIDEPKPPVIGQSTETAPAETQDVGTAAPETDKATEQITDKATEKVTDKATDKTTEKPGTGSTPASTQVPGGDDAPSSSLPLILGAIAAAIAVAAAVIVVILKRKKA
ncbi:MAG: hypothetical protein IJR89_02440 [Clostridia bacterium]|nr:hypothetical protein [Clostridia bacterium]